MNSFYTDIELQKIGVKYCSEIVRGEGKMPLISRKASIYGAEHISIGYNVRIDDFCILSGNITIGNNVHIAAYTALYGGNDGIIVEDYANLSSRVNVYSVNDDYSGGTMTNPMIPEKYKNVESSTVYIGKHVIVGATSVILPGVRLAEGSAFGSFSFINHDSEPWSVNAGIPFKKIKDRKRDLIKLEEQFEAEVRHGG